jgi:hypothetical protein
LRAVLAAFAPFTRRADGAAGFRRREASRGFALRTKRRTLSLASTLLITLLRTRSIEAGGYVTRQQSRLNQLPALALALDTPAVSTPRKVWLFDDTVVRQRHRYINANSLT